MKKENINFLYKLLNPLFFLKTIFYWFRLFIYRLLRKFNTPIRHYPLTVKIAYKKYLYNNKENINYENIMNIIKDNRTYPNAGRIKLATDYLNYSKYPNWNLISDDPEQNESLHRWNWLIYEITENKNISFNWGINLMRSWIKTMGLNPKGFASDTYTISERISNAVLFTEILSINNNKNYRLPNDIEMSIKIMANQLTGSIEYRQKQVPINHVINNARALFILGQYLQNSDLIKIAIAIIKNDILKLLTKNNFLRDGSSHYHFLFTRWILELLWISKKNNCDELENILTPIAYNMIDKIWFFLVNNIEDNSFSMPLIGDVSPDCDPDWLVNIGFSELATNIYPIPHSIKNVDGHKGWNKLWENKLNKKQSSIHINYNNDKIIDQCYPESNWYRVDNGRITVFWHTEGVSNSSNGAHSHLDISSFVLYWDGIPIIVDPGRYSYSSLNKFGEYSISCRAHNNIMVDNMEPLILSKSRKYPFHYRKAAVIIDSEKNENQFTIKINSTGYRRIRNDKIEHTRTFSVFNNQLIIEDTLKGNKSHLLETFFHFGPNIYITKNNGIKDLSNYFISVNGKLIGSVQRAVITANNNKVSSEKVYYGATDPFIAGWHFPSYGKKIETPTIVYKDVIIFPFKSVQKINFLD